MIYGVLLALFSVVNAASNNLDLNAGLTADDSNCPPVADLFHAYRELQSATSPEDALERTRKYFDEENWDRHCIQGDCQFEDDFEALAEHAWYESVAVANWVPTQIQEQYGARWARSTFRLEVFSRCGDYSGYLMADFMWYCNGAPGLVTAENHVRDEKYWTPFQSTMNDCLQKRLNETNSGGL